MSRGSPARLRAAHDLNNLLAAITARAEAALATPRLSPAARTELDEIRRRAQDGAALVRCLLGAARPLPAARPVALAPLLSDGAPELRRVLGPQRRLMLMIMQEALVASADPEQLGRALLDLVLNAGDATPPGGSVSLRLDAARVEHALAAVPEPVPAGDWAVIEVRDDGAGIAPALLGKVFEPFFTTKGPLHGSGIGLASVRAALHDMGGHVTIESAPGRGTAVCLYLRRTEAARGTVLLVEDEAAVRRVGVRALRRDGWHVIAVGSAEAALERVAGTGPDLVIADLVLPGMEGSALVRALRREWPRVPAILVSGYGANALPGDLDVAFLAKPYRSSELLGLAARLTAENRLRTLG